MDLIRDLSDATDNSDDSLSRSGSCKTSLKVLIEPSGTLMIKRKKERGLKRWHKPTVSTCTLKFF